jgi:hypothetical protein
VASTCCDKKRHTGLWWETLKERDHLEDHGIDWCVILRNLFKRNSTEKRGVDSYGSG